MERSSPRKALSLRLDPSSGRVQLFQVRRLVVGVLRTLNSVASDLSQDENHGLNFEVVGSSVASFHLDLLATATEPLPPFDPAVVFETLTDDLASVRLKSFRPDLTGRLLSEYEGLVRSLGSMEASVELRFLDRRVVLDESFRVGFESAVKESVAEEVSVVGFVDAVNAHTQPFAFFLYPKSQTEGRIECRFPDGMRAAVAESLKARDVVRVQGKGMFRPVGLAPYRVDVTAAPERLVCDIERLRRLVGSFSLVPPSGTVEETLQLNRRAAGLEP
jgi:hypothetical protein